MPSDMKRRIDTRKGNIMCKPIRFFKDDRGASAVEYALMIALITVAILAAVTLLGQRTSNTYNDMASSLNAAGGS